MISKLISIAYRNDITLNLIIGLFSFTLKTNQIQMNIKSVIYVIKYKKQQDRTDISSNAKCKFFSSCIQILFFFIKCKAFFPPPKKLTFS